MSDPCGILLLDKPGSFTSQDAVNVVRRLFSTRQVGHAGTLDPLATGLLVVMVGRAVKLSNYLTLSSKEYRAVFRPGLVTSTGDVTGRILSRNDEKITLSRLEEVLPAFRGTILQVPPMVSALKVGGKKLVDLARKGIEIERAPREITIEKLTASPLENGDFEFSVVCSKGTYIRTLCEDVGKALGCGGTMVSLRRTACGGFTLENAHTLETLSSMTESERFSSLIPAEELFSSCRNVVLIPFFERLARNGQQLDQKKLSLSLPRGELVRLSGQNGFFALGRVEETEEGSYIRPVCQMDISRPARGADKKEAID